MPNQELTQDQKSMKTLGICVMIIAGIDILASIITFIKPSTLGYLNDALANTGIDVGILTTVTVVIVMIICAIEFYCGWVAYKLRATKGIAVFCLIIGMILCISGLSSFLDGFNFSDLTSVVSGMVAIVYYFSWKKLQPGEQDK